MGIFREVWFDKNTFCLRKSFTDRKIILKLFFTFSYNTCFKRHFVALYAYVLQVFLIIHYQPIVHALADVILNGDLSVFTPQTDIHSTHKNTVTYTQKDNNIIMPDRNNTHSV